MDTKFYEDLGYPTSWLEDAKKYTAEDAYIAFDPAWEDPIPEIPLVSIDELLRRTAQAHPDRIAISSLGRDLSYAEFDRLVNQFATALQSLGLGKGDFVVPMLPPSVQAWIVFFAVSRIGATSAPLNVMLKEKEIRYQLLDCKATTVVTLDTFYPHFESLRESVGLKNIFVTNIKDFADPNFDVYPALAGMWGVQKQQIPGTLDFQEVLEQHPPTPTSVEIDVKNDSPLVIYTSGTTGEPKGSISTHHNLVHNTVTHSQLCRDFEEPVNFSILPMNHTGGYMVFQLPMFYLGGKVVSRPVFDIEDCFKAVQSHRVNVVFGPPTFYHALLMHPKSSEYDLNSLTLCMIGAAPVTKPLKDAWHDRFGTDLMVGWGGTETNTMGTVSLKNKMNWESVGVPYVGEVKIVEEGQLAKRGQVGEILFRGLQVSKGYLNKPEQTAASFQPDGWFRTGDAGYIDENDFLFYVDRIKDLIIASGYNIAPIEVETCIATHPAVAESAVVGVPDDYREETVKAFIVLKPESKGAVTEEEIIKFCREHIAAYKAPTQVEFIDALPKNAMGKTLRRILKDQDAQKRNAASGDRQ